MHVKSDGYLYQVIQRDVASTLLHTDEVRAIHTNHLRELVLRKALLGTQLPYAQTHLAAYYRYFAFSNHGFSVNTSMMCPVDYVQQPVICTETKHDVLALL